MEWLGALAFFAAGYLAAIFTWPAVRTGITGDVAEITRLNKRTAWLVARQRRRMGLKR